MLTNIFNYFIGVLLYLFDPNFRRLVKIKMGQVGVDDTVRQGERVIAVIKESEDQNEHTI